MSIASDLIRGHTDTIILAQLIKGDSYGYQINKYIKQCTDNSYELKEATLYTAFKRLETNGFISSYWGDENVGARRKYYSITPMGKAVYSQMLLNWNSAKQIIDKLVAAK